MYSFIAATLLGLVTMPLAGAMVDRVSVRWVNAVGISLFGLGLMALATSSSITQYIVWFALVMSLANSLAGSMTASTAISRWFTRSRGRALGISAIGTSVGGIAIPALIAYWLAEHGWRLTLEYFAYSVLVLVLPYVLLTVRGRPSDVGLEPEAAEKTVAQPTTVDAKLTIMDILKRPPFWLISVSLGLLFGSYSALLANVTPYAQHLGHSNDKASAIIMIIAAAGFIGKLAFGAAADKFSLRAGLWVAQVLVMVALVILSTEPVFAVICIASVLLGLAAGGMLPVWGAMLAQIFGLASYGQVMGLMGPIITLLVLPGYMLIGMLYDKTGGYSAALWLFAGVSLVSASLLLPLKMKPVTQAEQS